MSEEIITQATNNSNNVNKFGAVASQDFNVLADLTTCPIAKLWSICWESDPFGNNFKPIKNIDLPERTFKKARKALKDAGLFDFVPKKNSRDSRKTDYWMVRNLHAVKSHLYGRIGEIEEKIEGMDGNLEGTEMHLEGMDVPSILPETHIQQAFHHPLNKRTNDKILKEEKTAPLGALTEPIEIVEDDADEPIDPEETYPASEYDVNRVDDVNVFFEILRMLKTEVQTKNDAVIHFHWEQVEPITIKLIDDGRLKRETLETIKANTVFALRKKWVT